MQGSWLVVFSGEADWAALVPAAIARIAPADPGAHHILSREHDGGRWSVLLTRWSRAERDQLLDRLRADWDAGSVHRLDDLGDLAPGDDRIVRSMPRPAWEPLPPRAGSGFVGRLLYANGGIVLAMLRFEPGGAITDHDAPQPTDVFCLEGRGHVRVGDDVAELGEGEWVHWPAGVMHGLWTTDASMTTLMFERH